MHYSIRDARTRLSEILAQVATDGEVIITSGSSRKPIAKISRIEEPTLPQFGSPSTSPSFAPSSFDPPAEDELRLWNGEGD